MNFAIAWAFAYGVVSSGQPILANWRIALTGIVLAGPHDREVDAINKPARPIPSGRIPGRWGLYVAMIWTVLSLLVAATLGLWLLISAAVGLALAWAYSAPPFRLKCNGWLGNAACGFSYEGLAWITGAAAMFGGGRITALAPDQWPSLSTQSANTGSLALAERTRVFGRYRSFA